VEKKSFFNYITILKLPHNIFKIMKSYKDLELFPDILDGRRAVTGIIDSTFLERFSGRVYSTKLR